LVIFPEIIKFYVKKKKVILWNFNYNYQEESLVRECSSALLILSAIAIFNIFSSSLSSLALAKSSDPFLRAQAFVVTAIK